MRNLKTADGRLIPRLGLGTWLMGEDPARRQDEVRALQQGFDLGMSLVDTAEMYGNGGAEEVTGEAIRGRREEIYVVTKVLPQNASRRGTVKACEQSLSRLGTDHVDLFLLHWQGSHPLADTFDAFAELQESGKILSYGVSNFDVRDMDAVWATPHGSRTVANQVLYNLTRRGIERRLIPWCQERDVFVMAYSPLEQGRVTHRDALRRVADRHRVTPAQVALAWTLRLPGVVSIPKASNPDHVRENVAAGQLELTQEDLEQLDQGYPAPEGEVPLETL